MRKEIDPELYNYNKFPGPVFHQVGEPNPFRKPLL